MSIEFDFEIIEEIQGVIKVRYNSFKDKRGELWSNFLADEFKEFVGEKVDLKHDKYALNRKGVLRGIHGDYSSWKYVNVLRGAVFQVFVDNRPQSPTYLKHYNEIVNQTEMVGFLIPPGVGNGFLALEEDTLYNYKLSYEGSYNDHDKQFTIKWNSKDIGINWPIENPILSERDNI